MPITIHIDRAGHRVAQTDSLLLLSWFGQVTVKDIGDLEPIYELMKKKYGRFSIFSFVNVNNAGKVDPGLRARSAELIAKYDSAMIGQTTALIGSGLTAVLVRTFMVGLNLFTKQKSPSRVFSDPNDALTWLKSLPGQDAMVKAISFEGELAHFVGEKKIAA